MTEEIEHIEKEDMHREYLEIDAVINRIARSYVDRGFTEEDIDAALLEAQGYISVRLNARGDTPVMYPCGHQTMLSKTVLGISAKPNAKPHEGNMIIEMVCGQCKKVVR